VLAQLLTALLLTVLIQTPADIQAGWEARGRDGLVHGWAEWTEVEGEITNCIIHVPPLTAGTLGVWVHEIEHCRSGEYHR